MTDAPGDAGYLSFAGKQKTLSGGSSCAVLLSCLEGCFQSLSTLEAISLSEQR